MSITKRGSGYALNGSYEDIQLTLTELKLWYTGLAQEEQGTETATIIMRGYVRETELLLNKLEYLQRNREGV